MIEYSIFHTIYLFVFYKVICRSKRQSQIKHKNFTLSYNHAKNLPEYKQRQVYSIIHPHVCHTTCKNIASNSNQGRYINILQGMLDLEHNTIYHLFAFNHKVYHINFQTRSLAPIAQLQTDIENCLNYQLLQCASQRGKTGGVFTII